MDITFVINDHDFAPVTSTFSVLHVPEYDKEITTIDKRKHKYGKKLRTNIVFSIFPEPDTEFAQRRALHESPMMVKFSDKEYGTVREMEFDLESDLKMVYALHSIDGSNYYKAGEYTLVAVEVDNASNISNG